MVALKVMAVILAALVALDQIDETEAWIRIRVRIGIRIFKKMNSALFCPDVYGIACKTANVDIKEKTGIDFSGTGCKVDSSQACENPKRELSQTTADGLKYVPLPPQFEYYDTNGDQRITFEEFSAQILARYQIQDPLSLKKMFAAADVNDDGVLDPDEFSTAPFVQVTVHTRGEDIPNENGRNFIEEESKYEPSQTSENEP